MNISCISCPARYGVADAKLVGKRVRITCKRCGAILLVDGTVSPPEVSSGANAGPSVAPVTRSSLPPISSPPVAAQPASPFFVALPDGRQETADVAQIVRLYRDRAIDADTLVWREGMDDWLVVWDVEEIASAFRRMGYARPSRASSRPARARYDETEDASTRVAPSSHPPAEDEFDDDDATSVVDSSRLPLDAGVTTYERSDDAPTGVAASALELAFGRPRAAAGQERASARRGGPALDLFTARAERAEPELARPVEDDGAQLTGARSENSVLFSLDQLVRQEQQKRRPIVMPLRARTDESVLVDSSPSTASGVAGSPLVAPDFTAPVTAPPPAMASALGDELVYPEPKKKIWLVPAVAIVCLGAVLGAWFSGKLQPLLATVGIPVEAPVSTSSEPQTSASAASSAATPPASAQTAAPEAEAVAAPSSSAPVPSQTPAVASASRPKPPPELAASPAASRPSDSDEPKEPETKPAATAPFDAGAARTLLTEAANNASGCKEAGGPTGNGKVSITFAPSGRPMSVAVTGDLAGTTVGSCVAKRFRAVRVPPFSGDPVSVSKSFSVQ